MAQSVLLVAFSHTLTQAQIEGFYVQYGEGQIITLKEVAPELQAKMSNIPATATLPEIQQLAKAIVAEAVKAEATHFFCTGEPTLMMWANLYAIDCDCADNKLRWDYCKLNPFTKMEWRWSDKARSLRPYNTGLICIQSTTERKTTEVTNPDGTVTKTQIFAHVQWREMF